MKIIFEGKCQKCKKVLRIPVDAQAMAEAGEEMVLKMANWLMCNACYDARLARFNKKVKVENTPPETELLIEGNPVQFHNSLPPSDHD